MKLLSIIAVCLACVGCVSVESDDIHRQPTVGQQLIDLAKAHESGLLSDEEYKRERREILGDD